MLHLSTLIRDMPNVTLGELYRDYGTLRDEATTLLNRLDAFEKKFNYNGNIELRVEEIPELLRYVREIINMIR